MSIKVFAHQTELLDAQEIYIQVAVGKVGKMDLADDVDPFIYTSYSTFILVLQLCNVMYLWIREREQKTRMFVRYPRLHFLLDGNALYLSDRDPTHEVFGGIYAY